LLYHLKLRRWIGFKAEQISVSRECIHLRVVPYLEKYVGTLDLHVTLGGLPSHVSQGPSLAHYIPSFNLSRDGGQISSFTGSKPGW
jgi:hypothetical protein